jgi:hypothetical protein
MSMVGTIEDMRWEIKQQQKEIEKLRKFIAKHKLIREFDEEERKRAQERMIANGTSTY